VESHFFVGQVYLKVVNTSFAPSNAEDYMIPNELGMNAQLAVNYFNQDLYRLPLAHNFSVAAHVTSTGILRGLKICIVISVDNLLRLNPLGN